MTTEPIPQTVLFPDLFDSDLVPRAPRRHQGRSRPPAGPRDNPRFLITNLRPTPRFVYEHVYCARGDIENRIKELHHGLQIDRTSCCRFWANQFRVPSRPRRTS